MLHSKGKILPKITINSVELIEQFSSALRKEMHDSYLTSKALAEYLGVSEKTVKDWMTAKRFPNGIALIRLMLISPHIRVFVWNKTKSEKYYIDANMAKVMYIAFCDEYL